MIVNGIYFAHPDCVLNVDGLQLSAVKSLSYKSSLGRQYVRGTSPLPLGMTTGKYEAGGDLELYLPSAALLMTAAGGPEFLMIPHVLTVVYGPNVVVPLPLVTDILAGAYFTEVDASTSDSEDAITRKFAFKLMLPIVRNGSPDLFWAPTIGAVG